MTMTMTRRRLAGLAAVAAAAPGLAMAATAAREEAARRLIAAVRANYQDEAAANRLADAIAQKLAAGAYRQAGGSDQDFAGRVTGDLRAVVDDRHMAVMSGMKADEAEPSLDPVFSLRQNYGVQDVRRLGGNVGLIELNFAPSLTFGDAILDRYAAAMVLVRDTRALIIDVRQHIGGEPAAIAYFVSYFFDRPSFVVNRIRYRTRETEVFSTASAPRGPRYGERRPLFILTSGDSFSGAEELAYDLQATRRARVVGEVTGGGANPNEAFDLGGGFMALIPNGAAINPITGSNWEGVGVKPDVSAPADKAQDVAHKLALEAALAQATADAERNSITQALKALS
jgi:hypothetical protein